MAYVYGDKTVNRIVSHEPGVRLAVADAAVEIGAKAEGYLAAHRKTGDHRIDVEQGRTDAYVWLTGTAAMSVEFGHWVKGAYEGDTPKYVEGLYIITKAAGLI